MIDLDDVVDSTSDGFIFGGLGVGLVVLVIMLAIYFAFSKPEIDKCEADGQHVVVRTEGGNHTCIEKSAITNGKHL